MRCTKAKAAAASSAALCRAKGCARAQALDAIADGALTGLDRTGALTAMLSAAPTGALVGRAARPERVERERAHAHSMAEAMVAAHRPGLTGPEREAAVGRVADALVDCAVRRELRGLDALGWDDRKALVERLATDPAGVTRKAETDAVPAYSDFAGADAHGGMVITSDVLISDGMRMSGGVTIIDPVAPGLPTFGVPARPGQGEYSEEDWTYHDHDYTFSLDGRLRGAEGLAAVGEALIRNPTPGGDRPASVNGTLNNVGDLPVPNGRDNIPWADSNPVHSYVVATPNSRETDYVVNYTVEGEHFVADGMVMRYGRLEADGTITPRNYGEGNGLAQGLPVLGRIADVATRDVWRQNSDEIAATAVSSMSEGD